MQRQSVDLASKSRHVVQGTGLGYHHYINIYVQKWKYVLGIAAQGINNIDLGTQRVSVVSGHSQAIHGNLHK